MNHFLPVDYEYRAAVALNNMAIAMANRFCYDQALETLRGAAFAMKCATPHSTGASDSTLRTISNRLLHAYDWVSQPQVSPRRVPIRVIPPDEAIRFAHFHLHTNLPVMFMVRIEPHDLTSTNDDDQEYDLSTAIVLYNISVALLCKAKIENQPDRAIDFYMNAFDLLGTCHWLLHRLLDNAGRDKYLEMPSEIGISSTVLRVVFQTLKTFGSIPKIPQRSSQLPWPLRRADCASLDRVE